MSHGPGESGHGHERRGYYRFLAVSAVVPTVTSVLGIDGGAVFQILAVEDLKLEPDVIGTAFALGVLSVPLQLLAARMPLWRAASNLRLFLLAAALQCTVLALLLGLGAGGSRFALLALGITVVAEITLSVLYAPSWQPLLNHGLGDRERQHVNSRGRATGSLIMAGAVVLFGSAPPALRTAIIIAVAGVAVVLALVVVARGIAVPPRPPAPALRRSPTPRPPLSGALRGLYLLFALAGVAAGWPLFLVYADQVLWPGVNLGLLGAVQVAGFLAAGLAWRSGRTDLGVHAARAGLLLLAATAALAALRAPVEGVAEEIVTVGGLALAAASTSTVRMTLLERCHQVVDDAISVRAMTVLDVVASTSLQVGLFLGGVLVAFSTPRTGWPLDPYRIWLLAGAGVVAVGLAWSARRMPGEPEGGGALRG